MFKDLSPSLLWSHYPKQTFTIVADTPENLRLRQQSELQSQVLSLVTARIARARPGWIERAWREKHCSVWPECAWVWCAQVSMEESRAAVHTAVGSHVPHESPPGNQGLAARSLLSWLSDMYLIFKPNTSNGPRCSAWIQRNISVNRKNRKKCGILENIVSLGKHFYLIELLTLHRLPD